MNMETVTANAYLLIFIIACAIRGIQIDSLYKTYNYKYFVNCLLWWVMWPLELFTIRKLKREIINKYAIDEAVEAATKPFIESRGVKCTGKFQSATHALVQYVCALEQHEDRQAETLDTLRQLIRLEDVTLLGDANLTKEQRKALSRICFACYQLDLNSREGVKHE